VLFPGKVRPKDPNDPKARNPARNVGGKVMRLIVKFNIVFLAIFWSAWSIAAYVSLDLLRRTRATVLQHAAHDGIGTRDARLHLQTGAPAAQTQLKYQFCRSRCPRRRPTSSSATCASKFADYVTRKDAQSDQSPNVPPTGKPMSDQFRRRRTAPRSIGEPIRRTGPSLYMHGLYRSGRGLPVTATAP